MSIETITLDRRGGVKNYSKEGYSTWSSLIPEQHPIPSIIQKQTQRKEEE